MFRIDPRFARVPHRPISATVRRVLDGPPYPTGGGHGGELRGALHGRRVGRWLCETITKMDSSLRAELDSLRLRAYGPIGGDALDPEMLRRLQELEASARDDGRVESGSGGTSTLPSDDASSLREAQKPPPAQTAPPVEARTRGRVRRSWRMPGRVMLAAWAASVAVSAAIAAAATYSVVGILPVAVVGDAPQIATLEPDPAVSVPAGFMGAGASSVTYEFYGLTLFETSFGMYGGGGGEECFAAALTADIPEAQNVQGGYSMTGPSYSGCRVGNFPATITMSVGSAAPPELRAQYPDAVLQFIKDGDRIGVFLGERRSD